MDEQVSYRQYSGIAAENYERFFVPAIARPVDFSIAAQNPYPPNRS